MKKQMIMNASEESHDIVHSKEFLNESRASDKHFTRKRKMAFVGIITFIINFLSKSLQAELGKYFELMEEEGRRAQQASSKARQHIKAKAFHKLFKVTVKTAIDSNEIERYKGYRIFAIDGTELYLEPTKELVNYYGQSQGRNNGCKVRVSILCEMNDGIIIDACREPLSVGERKLAFKHIEFFETVKQKKFDYI